MNSVVAQPAETSAELANGPCFPVEHDVYQRRAMLMLRYSRGVEHTVMYFSTQGLIAAHIRSPAVATMKTNTTALSLLESRSASAPDISFDVLQANLRHSPLLSLGTCPLTKASGENILLFCPFANR